jgi:Holliday junction resolvasome RuvABC endonuclease subunit
MPRIIGVRCGADVLRYAVIDCDGSNAKWVNSVAEHKWNMPRTAEQKPQKLLSISLEFARILTQYKPVDCVAIKIPEYGRALDTATSMTLAVGAVVSVVCATHHVAVDDFLYTNIKLNSANAETYVLRHIAKGDKYWDSKLVDALAVGLKRGGLP